MVLGLSVKYEQLCQLVWNIDLPPCVPLSPRDMELVWLAG